MNKEVVMVYKNWHTDKMKEIRCFNTFKDAEKVAQKMIDQFKYWGGGSVPLCIEEVIWKKSGGYRISKSVDYSDNLYIDYARENGTIYGYYKSTHKEEKTIKIV